MKSEYNPTDALTKQKENPILNEIIMTGRVDHPVEKWVIQYKGKGMITERELCHLKRK